MSTERGAQDADNANIRNITHTDVVSPSRTNSKNASARKRRKLEGRSLFVDEELTEVIEVPARGKRRSVLELSTYEELCTAECGGSKQAIGDLRQEREMSPMKEKELSDKQADFFGCGNGQLELVKGQPEKDP